MREELITILPFVSFKDKIIRLGEFLVIADSKVSEADEIGETTQARLNSFAQNQKAFVGEAYNSHENEITFILPTNPDATKRKLGYLLEVLFFYLHKGSKITYFFSGPNIFCQEDFRFIVLQLLDPENPGKLFIKKRFKFRIFEELSELRISPVGCENVVTQNQAHGYVFRDIELDHQNEVFQYLINSLNDIDNRNLLQGISFYNRSMSCEITDDERFVWLSSSLEAFLRINQQNDKARAIKKEVQSILDGKNFTVIDKGEVIDHVADLITVTYDYRSSYIHGGERQTESIDLETRLSAKLGRLDFVMALMNLTSVLLVHNKIPDQKFEGILNGLFFNQNSFESVIRVYGNNADKALDELRQPESILVIYKFLLTADLQIISFERRRVERCLNNILHIFAKYAHENQNTDLARQIQQQIDTIPKSDLDKLEKWNDFLARRLDVTNAPEFLHISILVFQSLYKLLQFEFALF